jgi:Alpha/beta hydrolase family
MAGIPDSTTKTIVLVHGGFVDGSGWEDVYKILKKDGYIVSIVQNPMADSQVPWGVEALSGTISEAAWRTKPSWYLVATEDKMIPPPAQRFMSKRAGSTVVEVAGSHAIYLSQPDAVAMLIESAAKGINKKISR